MTETGNPDSLVSPPDPGETAAAGAPARSAQILLAHYRRVEGVFDESQDRDRTLRPHYARFFDALATLGPGELKRRGETGRRLVHEQGITYNVYGNPRGMERPWQLNALPLVIAATEWRALEAAVNQRATLLNAILRDCYTDQQLIHTGWLPPALVFAQRDFLRPCHGIRPPAGTYLHFYAADLARSPDGQWWVISDRTQIPTGGGYTLANRVVTSRILPEAFRDLHVERLAGFFREVQTSLASLGAGRTDEPRVVLLTPGPYNETYFEQAFLARYLGFMLVEGQDLTVRDDRVFLKTLSGLEPVHVILRRVDDDFCDPLELRNDSSLGVPGLVEALRAGNVAVANALGSGMLQSPAFLAFLPGLCREILGEDLKLPSVATWWCGQRKAERYVLEHLDELFVKPAFRSHLRGMEPDRPLSRGERDELKRRIRFQPDRYLGQERVRLSTAPALETKDIVPHKIALRVYAVARADGEGYHVMPGGLTRVARAPHEGSISMQRGGASKDTWILSERSIEQVTLLQPSGRPVELRRVGNNLPSRLADNFFWLGRYAERADSTTHLLRSALLRFSPETADNAMPVLTPLLDALEAQGVGALSAMRPGLRQNPAALEAELLAAIFDPERPGSLRAIAERLQRLGMFVRDRTSNDIWRVLSQLADRLDAPRAGRVMLASDAVGILNKVFLNLAAFHGLARENMTRAQGWRFLDMGVRMERSLALCSLLKAALRSPEATNPSVLVAVLEVADSRITYRSRYNLLPNIAAVYDLVLLDDTNPRSLLFQIATLIEHFEGLPRERRSALPSPSQRILLDLVTRLRLLDPNELGAKNANWNQSGVGRAIEATLTDLPRLSEAIAASYFAHSTISRAGRGSVS